MRKEDIIVLGSGPSLNQLTYLEHLNFHSNTVVGANQVCQLFSLDYIVYLDKIMDEYLKIPENRRPPGSFKNPLRVSYHTNDLGWNIKNGYGFEKDALHDGGNSGYMAINFAGHLDGKNILLCGFDLTNKNTVSGITRNSQHTNREQEVFARTNFIKEMNKLLTAIESTGKKIYNIRGDMALKGTRHLDLSYKDFFEIKRIH